MSRNLHIRRALALEAGVILCGLALHAPLATAQIVQRVEVGLKFGNPGALGTAPRGPLVWGPDGALYGNTSSDNKQSAGSVFRWDPADGQATVLHHFTGPDGDKPDTGLTVGPDGALYGLTSGGGEHGLGTAFRNTAAGQFTLLHSFGGALTEGATPTLGSLAWAPDGYFYGTTESGGRTQRGVAFRMSSDGALTVIHEFSDSGREGSLPKGQLTRASDGNLYGTASIDGTGLGGTIYRLTPNGDLTVLHRFSSTGTGGRNPEAAPVQGPDGWLYGTTRKGGNFGAGTLYRMALDGSGFSTLHHFAGALGSNSRDGGYPVGGLLVGLDGRLYGTCSSGGRSNIYSDGAGTVFVMSLDGSYSTVATLGRRANDAAQPWAPLVQGADGELYGTSVNGGNGLGTLYKLRQP